MDTAAIEKHSTKSNVPCYIGYQTQATYLAMYYKEKVMLTGLN